jgi:putative endonuclease
VLLLDNGSYYSGYARDLGQRYRQHLRGKGARCTRSFRPLRIEACWQLFGSRGTALRVEALLKSCDRRGKEALVQRPEGLAALVRRKTGLRVRLLPVPAPY